MSALTHPKPKKTEGDEALGQSSRTWSVAIKLSQATYYAPQERV